MVVFSKNKVHDYFVFCPKAIWVSGYLLKKSKIDPAAGIAIGALAVLPSNKCRGHNGS
jgi:hypothetical protein